VHEVDHWDVMALTSRRLLVVAARSWVSAAWGIGRRRDGGVRQCRAAGEGREVRRRGDRGRRGAGRPVEGGGAKKRGQGGHGPGGHATCKGRREISIALSLAPTGRLPPKRRQLLPARTDCVRTLGHGVSGKILRDLVDRVAAMHEGP